MQVSYKYPIYMQVSYKSALYICSICSGMIFLHKVLYLGMPSVCGSKAKSKCLVNTPLAGLYVVKHEYLIRLG